MKSTGIAIDTEVLPKLSARATRARAITAAERIARNLVTRLSASLYVSERSKAEGTEEQQLALYRQVRDARRARTERELLATVGA